MGHFNIGHLSLAQNCIHEGNMDVYGRRGTARGCRRVYGCHASLVYIFLMYICSIRSVNDLISSKCLSSCVKFLPFWLIVFIATAGGILLQWLLGRVFSSVLFSMCIQKVSNALPKR